MVRDTQIWELLGSIYFNVLKTDKQKNKKRNQNKQKNPPKQKQPNQTPLEKSNFFLGSVK